MADDPENLTLRLLQEMRAEMKARFDAIESAIGDLRVDVKEVSLATSLLEVRMGKVSDRLDRIEKHIGLVKA